MPLYDIECRSCGNIFVDCAMPWNEENLYPPERFFDDQCEWCCESPEYRRNMPLVAKYTGELAFNPQVMGGSFDTMGCGKETKVPEFGEFNAHIAKQQEAVSRLGPEATRRDHIEAARSVGPGPSAKDFRDYANRKDVKEAKRRKAEDRQRNRLKRQRAQAMAKDPNISVRHNRVAGDPKFT